MPDAPAPGAAASIRVQETPCRSRARTREAPATPAPITIARCEAWAWGGEPGRRASRRSRLAPKPGRFSTAKPAAAKARRTGPATVKVAARAPGALSAPTPASTSSRHICGFFAGAKPSRNQASARPPPRARASPTSPMNRASGAPPPARSRRWKPRRGSGQAARRAATGSASSGQTPSARAASSRAIRWASTEKIERYPPGGRVRRHIASRAAMFSPVPKPSSATVNRSRPAQAPGRPQPSRNTARLSARPSMREK